MGLTTSEEKRVKVYMPPSDPNGNTNQPFTILITPNIKFAETMCTVLGEYTHTICCIPYIKLGDTQIPIMVQHNSYQDESGKIIDDKPFNECIISGMNVYENITELGAYWT